ncbi:MAG TPA: hypothetical protein V6D18_08320 [Thermosynechococcaceae cyanobacterium]
MNSIKDWPRLLEQHWAELSRWSANAVILFVCTVQLFNVTIHQQWIPSEVCLNAGLLVLVAADITRFLLSHETQEHPPRSLAPRTIVHLGLNLTASALCILSLLFKQGWLRL